MSLNFDEDTPVQAQEVIASTVKRVNASDKRMINATTDVNQLVPFKYKWAWDMYLKACENNWMPQETSLENDFMQLVSSNQAVDVLAIQRSLAALTNNECCGNGQVSTGIYRCITAPEARQYLLRQGMEEILTTHAYVYAVETLKLDEDAVRVHRDMPTQKAKHAYLAVHVEPFLNPKFATGSFENDQQFLKSLIVYTCAMKGLFSVSDFAQILAMSQKNSMVGLSTIYQKMLRDQRMQVTFGVEVINAVKSENPGLWTPAFRDEVYRLIHQAFELEKAHALALGLPAEFAEYLQCAVGSISNQIGIPSRFAIPTSYKWLAGIMGLMERREVDRTPAEEKKVATTLDWD